jgi:PAS domain S-box-containing protein
MKKGLEFVKNPTFYGFLLLTLLYPIFAPIVRYLPNPMIEGAIIAINMIFPVLAGFYFGPKYGAISGSLGTFLSALLIPTPFEWLAIIPHGIMAAFSGIFTRRFKIEEISALSIFIGHFLNVTLFIVTKNKPYSPDSLGPLIFGVACEAMIEILIIILIINYISVIKKYRDTNQKQKLPFTTNQLIIFILIIGWFIAFGTIIYYIEQISLEYAELSTFAFLLPILVCSFIYNKAGSLTAALISSFISISIIFNDPLLLYSIISRRMILEIIFFGVFAIITSYLVEKLRLMTGYYLDLFNQVPVGLYRITKTGEILNVNAIFLKILGFPSDYNLKNQNILTFFTETESNQKITSIQELTQKEILKIKIQRDVNTEQIIKNHTHPVLDKNHNILYYQCSIEDITLRLKMMEYEIRQQKIETLTFLTKGMAHDFNNIIACVTGNIEYLLTESSSDQMFNEIYMEIKHACNRAKELTARLTGFSKEEFSTKQDQSVLEILKESIALISHGTQNKIELEAIGKNFISNIDAGKINQLFNNLIINAIQSMSQPGVIKIKIEQIELTNEMNIPLQTGEYILISVKDQGCGIPKSQIKNIFTPYFTTKKDGNGLGLAMSLFIVKEHGGYITFESEEQKGTIFFVYLPISKAK